MSAEQLNTVELNQLPQYAETDVTVFMLLGGFATGYAISHGAHALLTIPAAMTIIAAGSAITQSLEASHVQYLVASHLIGVGIGYLYGAIQQQRD